MAKDFYSRLRNYYLEVAAVLRGEAKVASIFPNTSDLGDNRERIYAEFLRRHAPSKCNVFLGGFLFQEDGTESNQLDVIVTTDTAPRFNLPSANDSDKSFSPVEGTLGVASIKSTLKQDTLVDALKNIASIPPTLPLDGRLSPTAILTGYDDWPYKIVYAHEGIACETLSEHLNKFYVENAHIPINRRPHLIHVAGRQSNNGCVQAHARCGS